MHVISFADIVIHDTNYGTLLWKIGPNALGTICFQNNIISINNDQPSRGMFEYKIIVHNIMYSHNVKMGLNNAWDEINMIKPHDSIML